MDLCGAKHEERLLTPPRATLGPDEEEEESRRRSSVKESSGECRRAKVKARRRRVRERKMRRWREVGARRARYKGDKNEGREREDDLVGNVMWIRIDDGTIDEGRRKVWRAATQPGELVRGEVREETGRPRSEQKSEERQTGRETRQCSGNTLYLVLHMPAIVIATSNEEPADSRQQPSNTRNQHHTQPASHASHATHATHASHATHTTHNP